MTAILLFSWGASPLRKIAQLQSPRAHSFHQSLSWPYVCILSGTFELQKILCNWIKGPGYRLPIMMHYGIWPQIETRDPRTGTIFILAWGSNWGNSGFSGEQNNRDSTGAYVLWSERETGVKCYTACRNHEHILFAFVSTCVVSKNPNIPNLSSMADDVITRGCVCDVITRGCVRSLFYTCGYVQKVCYWNNNNLQYIHQVCRKINWLNDILQNKEISLDHLLDQ